MDAVLLYSETPKLNTHTLKAAVPSRPCEAVQRHLAVSAGPSDIVSEYATLAFGERYIRS